MVVLNSIFTSHMVLQAGKPIRFFGMGEGSVSVTFKGEKKSAHSDGAWLIEFDPCEYGGPYEVVVELDKDVKVLSDVWVGDVYLMSGQSNMEHRLELTKYPPENYEGNENIRFFTVDQPIPQKIVSADGWVRLTKENAGWFPAVGYHVATALATEQRKIGLLGCFQGASVIQAWLPKEIAAKEKYQIEGKFIDNFKYPHNKDGYLYECMTKKILPFSVNTVLWYQGESNPSDGEAKLYLSMLEDLIHTWREDFCDAELPVIVVQIADCDSRASEAWRVIQKAQLMAQDTIPNVKTVISRDVCESDDIHPGSKVVLSQRIADLL